MGKPHPICVGCPREACSETHKNEYIAAPIPSDADLIILVEAPVCDRYGNVKRAFKDDSGTIIQTAVAELMRQAKYARLNVAYAYAVRCTSNQGDPEPGKAILMKCKTLLLEELGATKKNPVILAMGMTAVRALDIKATKLKDMQGRLLPQQVVETPSGPRKFDTVITISTKQIVAVPGLYTTFLADLERAAAAATTGGFNTVPAIETLTKDYVIPKTVEEVKAVCKMIMEYTEGNILPENWPISIDTETNTKFPHRSHLWILAVSIAWAPGKATAIPLWHPGVGGYDPLDVLPYLLPLLASKKPKFFHNAKFDLKVFMKVAWEIGNFTWDSMTGEHVLEEDKKGQYGLKPLTRTYFPDFASYADALHEILTKEEGDSQLHNLRKALKAKVAGRKKKKGGTEKDGGFEKIPLHTLLLYAAVDADMTRRLVLGQEKRILIEQNAVIKRKFEVTQKQARLKARGMDAFEVPTLCDSERPIKRLAIRNVFPVTPALARMEFQGIKIDRPYLVTLQEDLEKVVTQTTKQLYDMAGDLKLNSPAEIARVLFVDGYTHPVTGAKTTWPLTGITKTKKGQTQTTEKVMKYLVAAHKCPFATTKLIYSKAFKAKNTFCQNVGDLSELDGYLHTNYNQHGTNSGRLSSNDENMQNIPKKLANVNIKKVFVTDDDYEYLFVNADAKGAEVRILTAYCHDAALIASLNAGQDTHCYIASKIVEIVRQSPGAREVLASMNLSDEYPLTYEDFSLRDSIKEAYKAYGEMLDKFRTAVKRVVFGILYGAGPQKIAETIGISLQQAQQLIDMLFTLFPSIKGYMAQTRWELQEFGFVETFFGRRRRFSVINAPKYLLGRAERQTVNFKIQSTSSEIVMGRLVALEAPLRELGGRILLTVHDSIGFQIRKKYASQLPDFIYQHLEKGAAEQCPWLPVAFKWDFEVGPSYGELKGLDAYLKNTQTKEYSNDAAEAYTEEEVRTALAEV